MMTITLNNLVYGDSDNWRAFLGAQRGAQRNFLAYDYDRPYPLAYAAGFTGLSRAGGGIVASPALGLMAAANAVWLYAIYTSSGGVHPSDPVPPGGVRGGGGGGAIP